MSAATRWQEVVLECKRGHQFTQDGNHDAACSKAVEEKYHPKKFDSANWCKWNEGYYDHYWPCCEPYPPKWDDPRREAMGLSSGQLGRSNKPGCQTRIVQKRVPHEPTASSLARAKQIAAAGAAAVNAKRQKEASAAKAARAAQAKREADDKAKREKEAAAAAAAKARAEAEEAARLAEHIASILDSGLAATTSKDATAKLAELQDPQLLDRLRHNVDQQRARYTELQTLQKQLVLQEAMVAATAALDMEALDTAIADAQPGKTGLPVPLDESPTYAQAMQAHHQAFEKYVVSKCKLLFLTDATIATVWGAVDALGAVGPQDLPHLTEASLEAQGVLPLQAANVVQAFAQDASSSPYPARRSAVPAATGAPIPRSERSMHQDQANPPTQFTHDGWMGLKDALFTAGGTEKAVAMTMNIAQHYYSELMNMVGNKGRILAEIAAAHFDGSNVSGDGRGGEGRGRGGRGRGGGGRGHRPHASLNDRITAMDTMLASGTF